MQTFESLPERPERGRWYSYAPEGAVAADGSPWYCLIRPGNPERLVLILQGGGVSVSAYTEALPRRGIPGEVQFYRDRIIAAEKNAACGLGEDRPGNPFRRDTLVFFPCATGDFHLGTGDFRFTGPEGEPRVLHHHGYTNFLSVLVKLQALFPAPKRLFLCGCSAGGFGASALCETVLRAYPDCKKCFLCVDCAAVHYDWPRVAQELWQSPEEVRACFSGPESALFTGNSLSGPSLAYLAARYAGRLRLLSLISVRDATLSSFESFCAGGPYESTPDTAAAFCEAMKREAGELQRNVPGLSLYIFDTATEKEPLRSLGLTRHTLLYTPEYYTARAGKRGLRPVVWLRRVLKGRSIRCGLELLK